MCDVKAQALEKVVLLDTPLGGYVVLLLAICHQHTILLHLDLKGGQGQLNEPFNICKYVF